MNWKFILYDWYGLNVDLFQVINSETPSSFKPLAVFFSIAGNYWTTPLMVLGLLLWSKSATDPVRADAIWHRLIGFITAVLLGLLAATALKLGFDFPRPPVVLGELVRVIGESEQRYSLPSGHATYSAIVIGALWPLVGRSARIGLVLYAVLVGWSRIAAGMHFPADVITGWCLGLGSIVLAGRLLSLAAPAWQVARHKLGLVWYTVAICAFLADQLTKLIVVSTFAYGEQVEVTPFFNFVYVLNPGAAFSFLASAGGWQRYFFIILGLTVSAWLMRMLKQGLPRLEALGCSLILGGALGNVADRLLRGQVVDFLDFHWRHSHWPAFNLADVAIISGAALFIISALIQGKATDASKTERYRRLN